MDGQVGHLGVAAQAHGVSVPVPVAASGEVVFAESQAQVQAGLQQALGGVGQHRHALAHLQHIGDVT